MTGHDTDRERMGQIAALDPPSARALGTAAGERAGIRFLEFSASAIRTRVARMRARPATSSPSAAAPACRRSGRCSRGIWLRGSICRQQRMRTSPQAALGRDPASVRLAGDRPDRPAQPGSGQTKTDKNGTQVNAYLHASNKRSIQEQVQAHLPKRVDYRPPCKSHRQFSNALQLFTIHRAKGLRGDGQQSEARWPISRYSIAAVASMSKDSAVSASVTSTKGG